MEVATVSPISTILDAQSNQDNVGIQKNFYRNPREIDFNTSYPILDYEPVIQDSRAAKANFRAQCRTAEGNVFTLNLFGFSNFTGAFGIQGTQAMRATPSFLNDTIKSIAHRRNVDNAWAVGDSNHAFTRDLAGIQTAADLMDEYDRRKFSSVKSLGLTLNREQFMPTGYDKDIHFIDAIATATITFGSVGFSVGTDILRQICTNGMTQTIASSSKKMQYTNSWLSMAVEKTISESHGMKNAVDAMCIAKVKDTEKTFDYINAGGLPEWVGVTAKTLFQLQGRGDLTAKEQEKLCPFGIQTLWDFLNTYTYAMHRVKDLAAKQKLQEKLYKFTFREEFVETLVNNGCVSV